MSAAFSFGPLGAMTDLVVAPAVQVENSRELKTVTTSRGVRWAQRARRNPRTWQVSRPWQDPAFSQHLTVAASGLGPDMYLYDRACARQNLLPAWLAAGSGKPRRNRFHNPSFEGPNGLDQGFGASGEYTSVDSTWAETGTRSARIAAGGGYWASYYPLGGPTGQMLRAGLQPGTTYTIGGTIHLDSPQFDGINPLARRILVSVETNGIVDNDFAMSVQAPNLPGDTRLVVTFTIPLSATNVYLRYMSGSGSVPVWWDSITLEEGATDGSFFDGSHGGVWEGVPNASQSTTGIRVNNVPMLPVNWETAGAYVLPGRTYTVSAWAVSGSPLNVSVPGAGTIPMPAVVDGVSVLTVTPTVQGPIVLTREHSQNVSGVRIHEGLPDGRFYATEGTPCKVAVSDPSQTYQLVTDRETRIDYTVSLHEVGSPGVY